METASYAEEQSFLELLKKSEPPFDYEKQLFNDHFKSVKSVLNNENPPLMKSKSSQHLIVT